MILGEHIIQAMQNWTQSFVNAGKYFGVKFYPEDILHTALIEDERTYRATIKYKGDLVIEIVAEIKPNNEIVVTATNFPFGYSTIEKFHYESE